MGTVIKQVSLDMLQLYFDAAAKAKLRNVDSVILHHTWKPRAEWYTGALTWEAVRRYHMTNPDLLWEDIGYHVGIGPDDGIWLLRPIEKIGAHTKGKNSRSIGVVMVGNFDEGEENPYESGYATAIEVLVAVCRSYGLKPDDIYLHRDFNSYKTCPGTRIKREDVRRMVENKLTRGTYYDGTINIVVEHGGQVVGSCKGRLQNGVALTEVRNLAEMFGAEVKDEIPESRTVRVILE